MKLLLTSGGITNASIRARLEDLLGKPIEEAVALAIPTGTYGHRSCTPETTYRFVTDAHDIMCGLGWKSVGILELTALPTIGRDRWEPWVRGADVLLVDGGDATYLAHWIRASGLADLLPTLTDTVWAGLSAGSMCLTPRIGEDFMAWDAAPDDRTLGLVEFSIFPHLGMTEEHTVAAARAWQAGLGNPAYVMDDQSAIVVADGQVDVVSEGEWHSLP
jgi:dipeptidase E